MSGFFCCTWTTQENHTTLHTTIRNMSGKQTTDATSAPVRRYSDDAKDRDANQLRTFKLQVSEMRHNAKAVLTRVVKDPEITVEQMRVLAMHAGATLDCFFSIDKDHHRAYPIEDKEAIVKQLRKNDASVRLNAAQRMGKEERIRRKQAAKTTQRHRSESKPSAKTKKTSPRNKRRTRKQARAGGGVGQTITGFFGLDTNTELKEEAEQRRERQAQMRRAQEAAQRKAEKQQEEQEKEQRQNDTGNNALQQLVQGNILGTVQMFIPELLLSLGLPPQMGMVGSMIVMKGGTWIYNKFKGDGKKSDEMDEHTFENIAELQGTDFEQKHFTTYSGKINKEKRKQFVDLKQAYSKDIAKLQNKIEENEKLSEGKNEDERDAILDKVSTMKRELKELQQKSSSSGILKNLSAFSLDRMNPFVKPTEEVGKAMNKKLNTASHYTHLKNFDFGAMVLKAFSKKDGLKMEQGYNPWIKGIINAVVYLGGTYLLGMGVSNLIPEDSTDDEIADEIDAAPPPSPTLTKRQDPWTPKTVRRAGMFAKNNPLFTTSFCFAAAALLWQMYHQYARFGKNKQMAALLSLFEPRQDAVDSDQCTYRDTGEVLKHVDPDLHQTFKRYETTHISTRDPLEKVFYHVLTTQLRQQRTSMSVHREVMNEHLIRSDGTIRESVGEVARAVKHYAKVTNVVGRGWAYVKGLLGRGTHRARSSRRSSSSKTAKRTM